MNLTHNPNFVNVPGRAIAGLIDWQIKNLICLYSLTLLVNATTLSQLVPLLMTNLTYIWLPLAFCYPLLVIFLLSATGYSPGKFVVGYRITDAHQALMTFKRSVFRELIAKRVSAALFMLGYLNIAVDPDHQGWHDHFSDTYAHKTDDRLAFGIIVFLLLLVLQIYLSYLVITQLSANQALIGDLRFVIDPLVKLLK